MPTPDRRRTDRWQMSREINVADIITMLIALMSVAAAYFRLDGRISLLEQDRQHTVAHLSEIHVLLEKVNTKLDEAILREIQRSKEAKP